MAELPKGAESLAGSAHDPHQILRYGPMVWSTQFHPEFSGEVMADILAKEKEQGNPAAHRAEATDAPHARTILRRFVERIWLADGGKETPG